MGKRTKLTIFCRRCNACHPEGEHLAKPKRSPYDNRPEGLTHPIDELAKSVRTKALAKAMNQNKLVSGAKVLNEKTLEDAMAEVRTTPGATIKPVAIVRGGDMSKQKFKELYMNQPVPEGDGVALKSTAHPRGRKKVPRDISAASIETIPAPPSIVAEVERLGPKGLAKRRAENKKRKTADQKVLDVAEKLRLRALKSARQARWRAGKKKPKRKGKK